MARIAAFIRLGRPVFLAGGLVSFALGAAIAHAAGHAISWSRYALGQGAVTAFQLMTHYANDFFDLEADRANQTPTRWSGGSRVLPDGELPPHVAIAAALVFAAIGAVLAIVLGGIALVTLTVILLLAWSYSAPPFRLCAAGLGELDTAIVVSMFVPWLGFALQAPDLRGARLLGLTIVPLALLQAAMLIAIEFPDAAGDAATGKRTLVVRLGAPVAAKLYVAITALAFAWPLAAQAFGMPGPIALAMASPAPLALWQIMQIRDHGNPATFERMTLFAVMLMVLTATCALAAWMI